VKLTEERILIDYREKADAAAPEMFLDDSGNVVPGRTPEPAFLQAFPGPSTAMISSHSKYGILYLRM
jgi:gamma-glutamyltranspeptidase